MSDHLHPAHCQCRRCLPCRRTTPRATMIAAIVAAVAGLMLLAWTGRELRQHFTVTYVNL